jgi:hypothetical protein
MTGFAQRLVARSAGRSTGLPLLMPRPASRFETNEPPVLDEVTETKTPVLDEVTLTRAPVEAIRVTNQASDAVHAPAAGQLQGRPGESPRHEVLDDGMPAQRPQSETPRSKSRATPPDQPLPMASLPSPVSANVEALHPAKETPVSANVTHIAERSEGLIDQAMPRPLTPTIPSDDAKAERPAAPVITIGRIEVQFIAADKPVAAPRPELQRTRGFDAYARARRGIPR